jgi:toxin FitB
MSAKSAGHPLPVIDGLLAASAIHADMTLVSRDESYLDIAGLVLFNPWE